MTKLFPPTLLELIVPLAGDVLEGIEDKFLLNDLCPLLLLRRIDALGNQYAGLIVNVVAVSREERFAAAFSEE